MSKNESVVVLVPAVSTKYTRAHCSHVKLTPLYHIFAYLSEPVTIMIDYVISLIFVYNLSEITNLLLPCVSWARISTRDPYWYILPFGCSNAEAVPEQLKERTILFCIDEILNRYIRNYGVNNAFSLMRNIKFISDHHRAYEPLFVDNAEAYICTKW